MRIHSVPRLAVLLATLGATSPAFAQNPWESKPEWVPRDGVVQDLWESKPAWVPQPPQPSQGQPRNSAVQTPWQSKLTAVPQQPQPPQVQPRDGAVQTPWQSKLTTVPQQPQPPQVQSRDNAVQTPWTSSLTTVPQQPQPPQEQPRDGAVQTPWTSSLTTVPQQPQPQPSQGPTRDSVAQNAMPAPVEKDELAPVMAGDGSGLPYELWRGLSSDGIESLIAKITIPPRSPALHALWLRLITAEVTPSPGQATDMRFMALRLEVLYRSGLARAAAKEIAKHPAGKDPLLDMLAARNALAAGQVDTACSMAKTATAGIGRMPQRLKGQAIMLMGYCSAAAGDAAGAGLAAELARNEGHENSPGLEALDAISIAAKRQFKIATSLSLLDYKLIEKAGGVPPTEVLEKGEPALLASLALDAATPINLGLPAAEKAAKLNALAPEMLAAIYRTNAGNDAKDPLQAASGLDGPERRAALFKAAEREQSVLRKTRLIRALIDDSKRAGLQFQIMQALAPISARIQPQQEIGWFAETGIEIALVAGDYDSARRWIASSQSAGQPSGGLDYWTALVDIADPNFAPRGGSLPLLEPLAESGRFKPDDLHRLATVLDALNYNVPIPLWNAASRTPQPSGGFLPETGVLTELQDAAKKREFGRTVLLAMQALGPGGAEGAHMIALGDSIRALKRAGLEADARRLGLEALFAAWPRSAGS